LKNCRFFLGLLIGTHFSLIFLAGLFRHWGYLTSINDLANFDQAVWGTIQGKILLNTDVFDMPISRLAIHFDPIQLLFAPLYLINPTLTWFIAAQAFALSVAAWPIFTLASRVFGSEKIGLAWAVIFLVNPFLLNAAAWDFHPIALAVPFVAMGMLALESRNFKLMLFSALIILLCKEHLGIMVIGFGMLWWIRTRRWIPGIVLILLGAGHFYLVLKVIMPAFSPTGQHVMISEGLGQLSRYSWLGQSIDEIILTIVSKPFFVLDKVLITMRGGSYIFMLVFPFLGLPLIGLPFLLPAAADLAANMLAANSMPRSPFAYHSVTLVPILSVAAMHGVKTVARWYRRVSTKELSAFILIASAAMGYLLASFPLPGAKNVWNPNSFVNWPDSRVKEIRSLLGDDAAISVQANIGAHFSQRKEIYRFPNRIDDVDAVVLRLESPTLNVLPKKTKGGRESEMVMLDNHLQMHRKDFLSSAEAIIVEGNFGVTYWNDPWLVLKRGINDKTHHIEVKAKIEKLRQEWS
jgi:uncharacterized membrane protein